MAKIWFSWKHDFSCYAVLPYHERIFLWVSKLSHAAQSKMLMSFKTLIGSFLTETNLGVVQWVSHKLSYKPIAKLKFYGVSKTITPKRSFVNQAVIANAKQFFKVKKTRFCYFCLWLDISTSKRL